MVRTRFAPSPTGYLHIGSLRTALYAYAFAKSQGGKFILRIEDTDRKRFVPGATENLGKMLKLFGLVWDEGPGVNGPFAPYVQSERVARGIYQKSAEQLVAQGNAYYCFCPAQSLAEIKASHQAGQVILRDQCREINQEEVKKRLASGEKAAIRLRVPANEIIGFCDFVRKRKIVWHSKDVDEVMLLKSDGFPTYQLAVVVDDAAMKISHIIRAHEWLPSTPVQLLLFKYLKLPLPEIGHVTDILDPEGGKLSKRKRNVSCEDYLAQGYLPEAILNYVMLCGWAPKDNREMFTLEEFVENFQPGSLQVSNPLFNSQKLTWFNGQYLRQKSNEELVQLLKPFVPKGFNDDLIGKTIPLVKERLARLSDYADLTEFLIKDPSVDKKLFLDKVERISLTVQKFKGLKSWTAENLEKICRHLGVENRWHTGDYFMALRLAVTGRTVTPPLFASLELLGREKTIFRLSRVLPN
jgi:glutamyl-tRNA synthetase